MAEAVRKTMNDVWRAALNRPFAVMVALSVGVFAGLVFLWSAISAWEYTYPAQPTNDKSLPALIENGYIKIPFEIRRNKDCIANSTMFITRDHDYGPGLGVRTDMLKIDGFETSITDVGDHKIMLWFRIPPELPESDWQYYSRTQDDCGSFFDSNDKPSRPPTIRPIHIPPEDKRG